MKFSLRTKLSLSYVFVAMVCVVLISALTNFMLENQFKDYIQKNQEQKNKDIVSLIAQQYGTSENWNKDAIENIGVNALEQGLIIKVSDAEGKTIWDATVHNNGLCQQMIEHMAHNMNSHYPNWKGGYVETKYPVTNNNNNVGIVQVGYYGPYYFNDNDLAFINTLNKLLFGVGVFALLLSLLIGTLMAKRLSTPIIRVISTAKSISKGYFGDRARENSSTKEIYQLTETINSLADTLEGQEKLRKRLTADIAHELRTPLATLQSHFEAMIDGIWKPDTKRLKSCHEEILRINRMVGDLEKLVKYESENLVLNKTEFDLTELVQGIIKNFESEYLNKDIELTCFGEEETVYADRDKISQVVVNLLSNALKYTPQGGAVEVKIEVSEGNSKISIKDNGNGIPSEDIPYIFERFYRADKSRNRLTGGAGIGLTITRSIVEAHKGTIKVRSTLNEGTEFIISIPKMVE